MCIRDRANAIQEVEEFKKIGVNVGDATMDWDTVAKRTWHMIDKNAGIYDYYNAYDNVAVSYTHLVTRHHISAFRATDLPITQPTCLNTHFQSRADLPYCVTPSIKRFTPVQEFQPVVHRLDVYKRQT